MELQPVPCFYSGNEFIPPSVIPTPKTQRKPPSRVTALPDQLDDFNDHDKISYFSSIGKSLCSVATSCYLIKVEQCFTNWKIARHSNIPFQQLLKQS